MSSIELTQLTQLTQNQKDLKRLKINQIVPFGFSIVFVLVGITVIASQRANNTLAETANWVTHTYKVKVSLQALEKILIDAETGQRGFILTSQEEFLEPYNWAAKSLEENLIELRNEIQTNPEQLKRLQRVEALAQQKISELKTTIDLQKSNQGPAARALVLSGQGKRTMDELRVQLDEMRSVEEKLLEQREKATADVERVSRLIMWGGTALAIGLGSVISWFVARVIMRPIVESASAIASSSAEIAASTEQQERIASQQATSVNQTTTTMDELSTSSRQSAEQAEMAASSAQHVLNLTQEGNATVSQTLQGMETLKTKVEAIAEQILHLSEQTSQIGSISNLVSGLANQTNMLALNAAVEAARAGEHGKGFAVVASEIRKLADQSKRSAEKIGGLVDDVQNAINSTVMVTDEGTRTVETGMILTQETAQTFTEVANAINTIVLNSQQISLTAKQQAIAIQQVLDAMNSLNQGATETAGGISQTRVGTQRLTAAAHNLQALV